MSTGLSTPVEDVEATLGYQFVCCLNCRRQWPLTVYPVHCQGCYEPAQLGSLSTAQKRANLAYQP